MNTSSSSSSGSYITPVVIGTAVGMLACIAPLVPGWTLPAAISWGTLCPLGLGLAACVLAAIALAARKRLTGAQAVSSIMAFLVPVATAVFAGSAVKALLPGSRAAGDLNASLALLTMIFCAIGVMYAGRARSRENRGRWIRMVLPPVAAVAMVSGYAAWTIVNSTEYHYRDAVDFRVEKVEFRKPGLAVDGTVEVRKSGDYEFEGIDSADTERNSAKLEWAGKSAPKDPGTYKVKLVWDRGWENGRFEPEDGAFTVNENKPLLQVRLAREGTALRFFPIGEKSE